MEVRIKGMEMQEVTIESYTLCDKCNDKIKTESSYDAFECDFTYKVGDVYPEGGYGRKFELYLCQKCGVEAMELLKSNGFKVQEVNGISSMVYNVKYKKRKIIGQLEQPKCPKCKRKMSPSGGLVTLNITTYWTCFDCNERIEDVEVEEQKE